MDKIVVYLGDDRQRITKILKELEETTSIRWNDGKKPLEVVREALCISYNYFLEELKYSNSRNLLETYTEVTPQEFIELIQKEHPKDLQDRLEDFLEEGCVYYGEIESRDGKVLRGSLIYDSPYLETNEGILFIDNIVRADLTKLVKSTKDQHKFKEEM